ncbi:MAG: hypothetical protein EOO41_02475 [Methanobacteriota archaeon]|nr:MAG: hypothetical protein EOO41_02475 [Euryarchaeota archaeon]
MSCSPPHRPTRRRTRPPLPNTMLALTVECTLCRRLGGLADVAGARAQAALGRALELDVRDTCTGCLPAGVSNMHGAHLSGPFYLQLDSCANVAASADDRREPSRVHTLKMALHDGAQRVLALEVTPIPELSADVAPGTKLVVRDVTVRRGMLLLRGACVYVLGGGRPLPRAVTCGAGIAAAVPRPAHAPHSTQLRPGNVGDDASEQPTASVTDARVRPAVQVREHGPTPSNLALPRKNPALTSWQANHWHQR